MSRTAVDLGSSPESLAIASIRNALPFFVPLTIYPLLYLAASYGGWWIFGPIVFFLLADSFESMFGIEERNMDLTTTKDGDLLWYKIAGWFWVLLYPFTLIYCLWGMLGSGHMSVWEQVLMAFALGNSSRLVFTASHELIHRHSLWERRVGEFLLTSIFFAHEATEHVYVHHAMVGTPKDPLSAPKGVDFWRYFPVSVARSLASAWRFERNRLQRRHLPVWHYTNPWWRYILLTLAWYVVAFAFGGLWGVALYVFMSVVSVHSLRMVDYVQHYGLQRIRLPNGRFERVQKQHSWNASSKFSSWLYYNSQRHSDHHSSPTRIFPLLQHLKDADAPQLPGGFARMCTLAMFPKKWFAEMDPRVDEWRSHFYPEIKEWAAYESKAFAARPDAFERIEEIISNIPSLFGWIESYPELLDNLDSREFTELHLPDGFGPDRDFEVQARSGLARLYWNYELSVDVMKERISEIPALGVRETVEAARNWSNDKAFQVGMHLSRGNLTPDEASLALSNIGEASVAAVLETAVEEFSGWRSQGVKGGLTVIAFGDLASREVAFGGTLDVALAYCGGPENHFKALCQRASTALNSLAKRSIIFSTARTSTFAFDSKSDDLRTEQIVGSRLIFSTGSEEVIDHFEDMRSGVFSDEAHLRNMTAHREKPDRHLADLSGLDIEKISGGPKDIERCARWLQMKYGGSDSRMQVPDRKDVFSAAEHLAFITPEQARQMTEADEFWRKLVAALQILLPRDSDFGSATELVRARLASACGVEDAELMQERVSSVAANTARAIEEIGCMADQSQ